MYSVLRGFVILYLLCVSLVSVAQTRTRIVQHQVGEQETVYGLAQKYNTTVEKIYEINSWARSGIKVGDKLIIYTGNAHKLDEAKAVATKPSTGKHQMPSGGELKHTIEAGETLYRITRIYGISEQDLMRANPGISSSNFPIGVVLRIPRGGLSKDVASSERKANDSKQDSIQTREERIAEVRPVKVLLMLPFRKATRYLEFYQGFLMGMTELKKDGINIQVTALEADNDEAVTEHIFAGEVQGYDFVIGGVTEEQNRMLAQAVRTGYYIVPFSDVHEVNSSRLIQLNQTQSEVMDRVIPEFVRRYEGRTIVFTRRNDDAESSFVQKLKRALQTAGVSYKTINVSNSNLALMLGRDDVVVPCTPDRSLAEMSLRAMGSDNQEATVFGYPQWQSYGDSFVRLLHERGGTIYSTFYFDKHTSEAKQFLTRFNAWYNKRVMDSYPKYSVLGYDVARYFVRAYAAYGSAFISNGGQLPSDGLQMDIEVEKSTLHDGYSNSRFYFVSYERDGSITRYSY